MEMIIVLRTINFMLLHVNFTLHKPACHVTEMRSAYCSNNFYACCDRSMSLLFSFYSGTMKLIHNGGLYLVVGSMSKNMYTIKLKCQFGILSILIKHKTGNFRFIYMYVIYNIYILYFIMYLY